MSEPKLDVVIPECPPELGPVARQEWDRLAEHLAKLKILTSISLKDLKPKAPTVDEPRTRLSMGGHTELMVKEWKISREDQDQLALASHQNAAKGYETGFFSDLVTPFHGLTKDGTVRGVRITASSPDRARYLPTAVAAT